MSPTLALVFSMMGTVRDLIVIYKIHTLKKPTHALNITYNAKPDNQQYSSHVFSGEQYCLIKLIIFSKTKSFSGFADLIENVSVTKLRMSR